MKISPAAATAEIEAGTEAIVQVVWSGPHTNSEDTMAKTRKQKREEAEVRQKEYDALTTDQKIARAGSRRGSSEKELKRLRGEG